MILQRYQRALDQILAPRRRHSYLEGSRRYQVRFPQEGARSMKTVAYQFAETLAAAGIKRIYGVVGDRLNGLTDALRTPGQHRMGPSLPRRGVRLPARPISARAEQPITTRILYRRPFLISMKQTVMASMLNQGGTT